MKWKALFIILFLSPFVVMAQSEIDAEIANIEEELESSEPLGESMDQSIGEVDSLDEVFAEEPDAFANEGEIIDEGEIGSDEFADFEDLVEEAPAEDEFAEFEDDEFEDFEAADEFEEMERATTEGVPAPILDEAPIEEDIAITPEVEAPAKEEELADEVPEETFDEFMEEPVQQPVVMEEFDENTEAKWNDLYNKYLAGVTSDEQWAQIVGEKLDETYTVQGGDTLWDISITFFGSGYYWPKIWQLNETITNPHLIEPGFVLTFNPGTFTAPPRLDLAEGEVPPANAPSAPAVPVDPKKVVTVADAPVIPPAPKYRPVLETIPPSLPQLTVGKSDEFDRHGFSLSDEKAKIQEAKVYVTSYISEDEPESIGLIVEAEMNNKVATFYQYVYVKMESGQLGQKYLVFKIGKPARAKNFGFVGYPVILQGEIKIVSKVEENLYKALVTRAIQPLQVGSHVGKGSLLVTDTSQTKRFSSMSAHIIGGEYDSSRSLLGYNDLIYLNGGSEDGAKVGDMVKVLKSHGVRKEDTFLKNIKELIALAKIVKVTPRRSTAVILNITEGVRVGDYTGELKEAMDRTKQMEQEMGAQAAYIEDTNDAVDWDEVDLDGFQDEDSEFEQFEDEEQFIEE